MSEFMQVLNGSTKRACIDERIVNRKSLALREASNFLNELRDEVSRTNRLLPVADLGLILMISAVMVTDIVRDTAGAAGEKEAPILKPINWVYDKARSYRDANSRNVIKKHAEYIDKVLKPVKDALPKNETGKQIVLTLDVFTRLAKNAGLLITAMQDSESAGAAARKSLNELNKSIEALDKKLNRLDYWQSIGEGRAGEPKMSRAPTPKTLP